MELFTKIHTFYPVRMITVEYQGYALLEGTLNEYGGLNVPYTQVLELAPNYFCIGWLVFENTPGDIFPRITKVSKFEGEENLWSTRREAEEALFSGHYPPVDHLGLFDDQL